MQVLVLLLGDALLSPAWHVWDPFRSEALTRLSSVSPSGSILRDEPPDLFPCVRPWIRIHASRLRFSPVWKEQLETIITERTDKVGKHTQTLAEALAPQTQNMDVPVLPQP